MRLATATLVGLALLSVFSCNADPLDLVLPGDGRFLVEDRVLLEAVAELPSDEQKGLARAYLARHPTGSMVPPGTTLREAIDDQREHESRERLRVAELEAEAMRRAEEARERSMAEQAQQAARDAALQVAFAGWRHVPPEHNGLHQWPLLEQRIQEQEATSRLLEGGTRTLKRLDAETERAHNNRHCVVTLKATNLANTPIRGASGVIVLGVLGRVGSTRLEFVLDQEIPPQSSVSWTGVWDCSDVFDVEAAGLTYSASAKLIRFSSGEQL